MPGIRSSIAKQFGITKKGWVEERKARGIKSKKGRKNMSITPYRRKRADYRGSYSRIRRIPSMIPSISSMVVLSPHVLSNFGVLGLGYDAVGPAVQGNFPEAIKRFFVNELLMFTGYDAFAQHWTITQPLMTYGTMFAKKIINRYFRGYRIGPLRI